MLRKIAMKNEADRCEMIPSRPRGSRIGLARMSYLMHRELGINFLFNTA